MMARHPNKRQLSRWLDGDAPNYDSHVDTCGRCTEVLEEIAGHDVDDHLDIGPALLVLLKPPSDLEGRVSRGIARRVQARNDAELFSSLFGVAIEAAKIVLEPPDNSGE